MSVASLFVFRRRPGWRTLRIVSFAYPTIPLLFITVGVWMIIEGLLLRPIISLLTVLTVVTGALLYRFSVASRTPQVN
jgi:basic amino acid/polyamine antiporter, APA family